MNRLTDLANIYASDKGTIAPTTGHHGPRLGYTEVYHSYFEDYKNKEITFLEIGIGSGPSINVWNEYFTHKDSKIYMVDIHPWTGPVPERVTTIDADQSSRNDLRRVIDMIGEGIDIIVDDGSHVCSHQQGSLGFLFEYLKSCGQYWVEDLCTSDVSVWGMPGKKLYGYDMSDCTDPAKNTVEVFEKYGECNIFSSAFLNDSENQYLTDNIDTYKMFQQEDTIYGFNKLALFTKK